MDIRYRDGGYDAQPALPFSQYTMLMEFNPLDVVLPAGHALRLELSETGEDYLPGPCASNPAGGLTVNGGTFGLPLIDRPVNHESLVRSAALVGPATNPCMRPQGCECSRLRTPTT